MKREAARRRHIAVPLCEGAADARLASDENDQRSRRRDGTLASVRKTCAAARRRKICDVMLLDQRCEHTNSSCLKFQLVRLWPPAKSTIAPGSGRRGNVAADVRTCRQRQSTRQRSARMNSPQQIQERRRDELLRRQLGPQLLAAIADPRDHRHHHQRRRTGVVRGARQRIVRGGLLFAGKPSGEPDRHRRRGARHGGRCRPSDC